MGTKSGLFFWAVCDRCGSRVDGEYGEGMVHESEVQSNDAADDQDWHVEGGNHICYGCLPCHSPDWDEEHEEFARGGPDLDCPTCRSEDK
jgi:hypothetical protein